MSVRPGRLWAVRTRPAGMRRCRGFSLLEVLVAFTIFVLVAGALFQVFSSGLRNARVADAYTRAVLIAESKLAELDADETLREGVRRGRSGGTYEWEITTEPYPWPPASASRPELVRPLQSTVAVSWQSDEGRRSVSLTSMHLVVPE